MRFCQDYGVLNRAALEYIQRRAPLSVPVRTIAESANLIARGFKSAYYCQIVGYDEDNVRTFGNAIFGVIPYDRPLRGVPTPFEIVGLPPPAGTRVCLRVNLGLFSEGDNAYASVFLTKAEAIDMSQVGPRDVFDYVADEINSGTLTEADVVARLDQGRVVLDEYCVVEVVLP